MDTKRRIEKIEADIVAKDKKDGPIVVFVGDGESVEGKKRELRVVYGEDYKPRIIVISPNAKKDEI